MVRELDDSVPIARAQAHSTYKGGAESRYDRPMKLTYVVKVVANMDTAIKFPATMGLSSNVAGPRRNRVNKAAKERS